MNLSKAEKRTVERIRDPFYMISEVLGIEYLTTEQKEIIKSVWLNKYTGVPSAHAVGKTFIAAVIVICYLLPYPNTIVLTTAPTLKQVRDLLWREIAEIHKKSRYNLGGILTQLYYQIAPKWFAVGIAVEKGKEEQSAVNFQGYHSGRVLVIVDEAGGVHPAIWGAIDGITSNEEAHILAIGNPSMINVPFHKHTKETKWKTITISALTHPNIIEKKEIVSGAVAYSWILEKIHDWCLEVPVHDPSVNTFEFEGKIYVPNNLFRWKVLGLFPTDNEEGLFSYSSIQSAMNAETIKEFEHCNMAIDVARFGEDDTVFTFDKGNNFTQYNFHGLDVVKVADKAIDYIKIYRPTKIGIDVDGIGSGVFDILKSKRENEEIFIIDKEGEKEIIDFQLVPINSGSRPLEILKGKKVVINFLNLRCQMYWQLRIDLSSLNIPKNEKLEEELLSIDYETPNGVIKITKKEDIKALIGRSPDNMDSLVYCNWLKYVREKRLKAVQRI